MIINQTQDQLELGGGGEAGGRLQVVLPLNLDCGKNLFVGAGTPMEGRVLPWPAGRGRRTPWTTRC